MMFLGAASSALDLLSFLQPQKVTQTGAVPGTTSGAGSQANGFVSPLGTNAASDPGAMPSSAGAGSNLLDPNVMGFLIQNQGQQTANTSGAAATLSPRQAALFAKLDTNRDGTISKSEFDAALGTNANTSAADAAFKKLDTNADGSIDPSELAAARPHRHHRHHHMGGDDQSKQAASADGTSTTSGANGGSASALAGLLDTGGTSTTATNPDGSTVTKISYADGSTITMTTPQQSAAATTSSNSTSAVQPTSGSANSLETLIRLQAQLFSSATVAPPSA